MDEGLVGLPSGQTLAGNCRRCARGYFPLRWSTRRRFDPSSSPSATPQYSSVSDCSNRQQNERAARQTLSPSVLRCYPLFTAQTVVFARGFRGWILRHCTVHLCIPLFEATAKTTSSAIKAVAASSAMLPLVAAQTVASGRGFGGCILRGRTHGRQAQAARRRTQNSARQILRFMVALRREPMSPTGLGFAELAVMEWPLLKQSHLLSSACAY
jgi:hypothetical protein